MLGAKGWHLEGAVWRSGVSDSRCCSVSSRHHGTAQSLHKACTAPRKINTEYAHCSAGGTQHRVSTEPHTTAQGAHRAHTAPYRASTECAHHSAERPQNAHSPSTERKWSMHSTAQEGHRVLLNNSASPGGCVGV